jgi:Zn-dependent M32 family carboxypeptidase
LDIKFLVGWSIGISNFILTVYLYRKQNITKYKNVITKYNQALDKYDKAIQNQDWQVLSQVEKELDEAIKNVRSISNNE